MNERIQELAKQAGAQGIVNRDFIDIEKFAALIVKECTDICEYWDKSINYTSHGQIMADKIKKHFGVDQ